MRIGALASLIYNVNIDTRKSGVIKPNRYIMGATEDSRTYVFSLKPKEKKLEDETLNNPVKWNNFKAGLKKAAGIEE